MCIYSISTWRLANWKKLVSQKPRAKVKKGTQPSKGAGGHYAYEVLRRQILSLELAPNTKLEESQLARELGVSRTPLREALVKLSAEDLVELLPNRGSRVVPLSFLDLPRYFEALTIVQQVIHYAAALRWKPSQMAEIRATCLAFEELAATTNSLATGGSPLS